MGKSGYSDSQGPAAAGSAGPIAEALGAVQAAGRTRSASPPRLSGEAHLSGGAHLSGQDASNQHYELTYFDPPQGLEPFILTLFHFVWDREEIADRHPGALPQIFLTPRGRGEMHFGDRIAPLAGPAHMFSGFERAAPFVIEGPWHAYGASLTPLGWAALANAPANAHIDQMIPAGELLGNGIEGFAKGVNARYCDGAISGEQACGELAEWIRPRLSPVPPPHAALIVKVMGWLGTSLNPDVEDLFEGLGYSRRQAERLVARYFGFTPGALARRYRAIRAAHLLAEDELTDEAEAEIAAAFYDQPHMIREIRRYCGYTPSRLGGEGEPLFQQMLRMRNLERLKPFRAIGRRE